MDVFLLAGQSNLAGRGGVISTTGGEGELQRAWDGVVPDACQTSGVWCLRPDGEAWVAAREPLHAGAEPPGKTCGVGPGLAFAAALRASRPATGALGLVPCAVGGSALAEWELPHGKLGQRAVERVCAALAAAPPCADAAPRLAGVLFYQGETDAGNAEDAASWGTRFAAFAAALREELQSPLLPLAVVAITTAPLPNCAHVASVRAAQLALPDVLPRCCVVDAAGLELQADGLHLTTAAAVTLGQRLAAAWKARDAAGWA